LDVVGDQEQRLLGSDVGEQIEGRQADEEDRRRLAVQHAEGGQKGFPLWRRQFVDLPEHRTQQLVQTREREVRLGLDAGDREDPAAAGSRGARTGVEDGGLPDAGLSVDQERAATVPDVPEPLVQERDFAVTSAEGLRGHASRTVVLLLGCGSTVTDTRRLR
jgi:hypothetical protein